MSDCLKCGSPTVWHSIDLAGPICGDCDYEFNKWADENRGSLYSDFLEVAK